MAKYCINCGNELDPSWRACPNCGTTIVGPEVPISPQPSAPAPPQTYAPTYARTYPTGGGNNYGVVALICGIIGLCIGGVFLGIIAIIVGILGLSRDENTSLATAGLILGILDFVCSLILLVALASWYWYL
jgi:hypothetical protein